MSNYYSQNGEPYNPQQYYPDTYNLWQKSQYYDIYDLSPQNCASLVWASPERCESKEEVPIDTDSQNGPFISRDSLYLDPEMYDSTDQFLTQASGNLGSPDYEWTSNYWHKEGEAIQGPNGEINVHKAGKMQRKLKEALAQPVKLPKAESMMQKMGWQGGALGKTGEGIVEPVAPNAVYAKQTIGFGQIELSKIKQNMIYLENKDNFNTNVLLNILEFVKNDEKIEMAFDNKLRKNERKQVHCLVHDLINGENMSDFFTVSQMDIVKQIHDYNCYVLNTQSVGTTPNRQLFIYKEAPSHVYLITPDDLKDQEYDKDSNRDVDESNPFLKSITKNLKQEKISRKLDNCNIDSTKTDRTLLDTIVEYFIDFSEQSEFTEFRFLGPFSGDEIEQVNEFLRELYKCMNRTEKDSEKCRQDLLKIFECGNRFGFYEDINGSTVIYKVEEEVQYQS